MSNIIIPTPGNLLVLKVMLCRDMDLNECVYYVVLEPMICLD